MDGIPLPVPVDRALLLDAAERAAAAIPPAWPLVSSVAVNPFLGQSQLSLAAAGARLQRIAGAAITMPRDWYRQQIAAGVITDAVLAAALASAAPSSRPADLAALKTALHTAPAPAAALPTVADLAAEASGIDWPGILAERIGCWAAGHFDQGQALWSAPRDCTAYAGWRAFATHDLTPEILGLSGFARRAAATPEHADDMLAQAVEVLGIPAAALDSCFHQLLMSLGGWAQYARHLQWQAALGGTSDTSVRDLLAIRLAWEVALFLRHADRIAARWRQVLDTHATPAVPTPDQWLDAILQEALERAEQRALATRLAGAAVPAAPRRPLLQAVFCIDVRSEPFRRRLEALDPHIRTLGFAGFFGVRAAHRCVASDVEEWRLPVLLEPRLHSCAGTAGHAAADHTLRIAARAQRAWGRFKRAAVSSFAFVEAVGPLYAARLLLDSLGASGADPAAEPAPRFEPLPDLATRAGIAESVLCGMSLRANFARLVLLVGHGARVVNNPHASALQCGACGGYSGEVNARLLAALLNDPQVREELARRGIAIPADTLFVGALHDTTTERVTLFAHDHAHTAHRADLARCDRWLAEAAGHTREERARRFTRAARPASLFRRSRDWSEVRPEWALAGCSAFIAAPRARTAGGDFGGRAFLHEYDWRQDPGFAVLELIMTAPVVVASWISLQYYGSTVAPELFGSGNKLLHNVSGGIGVVEGNGGLLRAGLSWQSVHDGLRHVHVPLRLSVCIEAPLPAITDVLCRHPGLQELFDQRWLHLFALDDSGRLAWRYAGDRQWDVEPAAQSALSPA